MSIVQGHEFKVSRHKECRLRWAIWFAGGKGGGVRPHCFTCSGAHHVPTTQKAACTTLLDRASASLAQLHAPPPGVLACWRHARPCPSAAPAAVAHLPTCAPSRRRIRVRERDEKSQNVTGQPREGRIALRSLVVASTPLVLAGE